MNIENNTVLITGGGSGIGLETAKVLSAHGNKVIIVGRNEQKLVEAAGKIQNLVPIRCDITSEEEVNDLMDRIRVYHSDLNMIINNAGKAYEYNTAADDVRAYDKAREEMTTNFLAPVRLTELTLPLLKQKKEAAIINISSIVSFAPGLIVPTYSATKAALHSYSQTLRLSLKSTTVKVFEVLPPLVDTDFARTLMGEKLAPSVVADEILKGLETDHYEIHIGATASLYKLFLSSPTAALNAINHINVDSTAHLKKKNSFVTKTEL
jgi:uncharacterized oxidoreductase